MTGMCPIRAQRLWTRLQAEYGEDAPYLFGWDRVWAIQESLPERIPLIESLIHKYWPKGEKPAPEHTCLRVPGVSDTHVSSSASGETVQYICPEDHRHQITVSITTDDHLRLIVLPETWRKEAGETKPVYGQKSPVVKELVRTVWISVSFDGQEVRSLGVSYVLEKEHVGLYSEICQEPLPAY